MGVSVGSIGLDGLRIDEKNESERRSRLGGHEAVHAHVLERVHLVEPVVALSCEVK